MEVTIMERHNLAEIYAEVKTLFDGFAKLWQGWGIDTQPISERNCEGLWLIKHGENVLRPLRISIVPDLWDRDELPWISLVSNDKINVLRAEAQNRHYVRSYFERLTEYLVLEAAQPIAIEKSKLPIRKSGKHLYLNLPVGDEIFWFSFHLRRKGWTWTIRRWLSPQGWVVMDRVYRQRTENPIEMFAEIISNIGLALL
jgi:hypothetical protein